MAVAAAVLICGAIVALIYGVMMKMRAGRVADAPFVKTGEAGQKGTGAANAKGAISVEGNVMCREPLVAPVSGTPCLYYAITVTAEWKEGQNNKTKEIAKEKHAAPFTLDDGTGPVQVDAREGGDFEPQQVKTETKGTGIIGGITGQEIVFGQYRVHPGAFSMGTKFNVREEVLPVVPKLYACGKAGAAREIASPSWRQLLLTSKSRDDYMGSTQKAAKLSMMGGAASMVVGAVLGVVAHSGAHGSTAAAENNAGHAAPAAAAAAPQAVAKRGKR